jgi:hypothetical protein
LNAIHAKIAIDADGPLNTYKDTADCRYCMLSAIIVFLEVAAFSEITESELILTPYNRAYVP